MAYSQEGSMGKLSHHSQLGRSSYLPASAPALYTHPALSGGGKMPSLLTALPLPTGKGGPFPGTTEPQSLAGHPCMLGRSDPELLTVQCLAEGPLPHSRDHTAGGCACPPCAYCLARWCLYGSGHRPWENSTEALEFSDILFTLLAHPSPE